MGFDPTINALIGQPIRHNESNPEIRIVVSAGRPVRHSFLGVGAKGRSKGRIP